MAKKPGQETVIDFPGLFQKEPGGKWYIRKQINGSRRTWCTGTTLRKEAQRLGRMWVQQLEKDNVDALLAVQRRRTCCTIQAAVDAYLGSGLRRCTRDTAMDNIRSLRILVREGGGLGFEDGLDKLTPELVRRFYSIRLAGKETTDKIHAATTANSMYRTARSIFGRRNIQRGVFQDLKIPEKSLEEFRSCEMEKTGDTSYELPDSDLISHLLHASTELREKQPAVYIAFLLPLTTGMRRGEASWLEFSDICQWGNAWIAVVKNKATHLTKSRKARRIPINLAVIEEIQRVNSEGQYVIPGNQTFRTVKVWQELGEWMRSQGWDRFGTAHELRKFFGAQVSTELGLYAAQKYLGHHSPEVTAKYYADLVELQQPTLAMPSSINLNG